MSDVPVNCITFDQLGTRLFAGDAAGTLTEVSLDLTPLSTAAAGSWSQAGWGAGLGPGSSPSSCDGLQPGGGGGSCGEAGAAASGGGGSGNRFAGGQTASGGAGLVASVLRHGSTATQQLAGMASTAATSSVGCPSCSIPRKSAFSAYACGCLSQTSARTDVTCQILSTCTGAQLMRKLRVSQELAGCPIMSLTCHPGGHHLIALARCVHASSIVLAAASAARVHCGSGVVRVDRQGKAREAAGSTGDARFEVCVCVSARIAASRHKHNVPDTLPRVLVCLWSDHRPTWLDLKSQPPPCRRCCCFPLQEPQGRE